MNTTIFKDKNKYFLHGEVGLIDKLPNKVFVVKESMFGMFLEEIDDIKLPAKIYSNDKYFIEHVVKSYTEGENSVSMLLSGKKGLGKSFTANVICQKLNLPIIKITSKMEAGTDIFGFLSKIQQEHVIFIDEFEKIFSDTPRESPNHITQQDFLSFLDSGSIHSKRVFIITANGRVSEFLLNRPTRIRYHREYDRLAVNVIQEIVDDLLIKDEYKEDLINNVPQKAVNIDVLIKIIEEVNLHDRPYSKFKDFFNFSAGTSNTFDVFNEKGNRVYEDIDLRYPFKPNQNIFYHPKLRDDCYIEEIISETPHEVVIRIRVENPDYDDEVKGSVQHLFETYVLKHKFHVLYDQGM